MAFVWLPGCPSLGKGPVERAGVGSRGLSTFVGRFGAESGREGSWEAAQQDARSPESQGSIQGSVLGQLHSEGGPGVR